MAIHPALSGEPINIRPLGSAIKTAGTATLCKTQHLTLFRRILLATRAMPRSAP